MALQLRALSALPDDPLYSKHPHGYSQPFLTVVPVALTLHFASAGPKHLWYIDTYVS